MKSIGISLALLFLTFTAHAQLPAEAVDLAKVKITEHQKSDSLCPVTLDAADAALPTWEHEGVTYRGATPEAQATFLKDPGKYVEAHKRQLWENNFVLSMSRVWCPVTDQVNPGGLEEWVAEGLTWESCCEFCSMTVVDEDFPPALERLKARAKESYDLSGGVYAENVGSPVEGAIRDATAIENATANADCENAPAYLEGQNLEATYSGGVAMVFENRCLECHRMGGLSPIDFSDLAKIRRWTKNMKASLQTRRMPPWPEDGTGLCFSNSLALNEAELDLMLDWVNAKFPPGEGNYNQTRSFGEWNLGDPDAVLEMPEYTVGKDVAETIATIEVPTDFGEDKWVVAAEVKPEDNFLVTEVVGGVLGLALPGNPWHALPEGYARMLKAGASVPVQVRYVKDAGWEASDATRFALKFAASGADLKQVHDMKLEDTSLKISAGAENVPVVYEHTLEKDIELIALTPNLRERGKKLVVTLTEPGKEPRTLLSIPHWNHKWRMTYQLAEPLTLPKGSVITLKAVYDNSAMNVENLNPDIDVNAGADGEALELWLTYAER